MQINVSNKKFFQLTEKVYVINVLLTLPTTAGLITGQL